MKGTLLLLPNVLGDVAHAEVFLPASVGKAVQSLDGLIAESVKGGRRFLSRFRERPDDVPLALYNKHETDVDFLLEPIVQGEKWGLVSDAGLPCIADPGAELVKRARERGLAVKAFVGPSSVTLGLMLSGLPSQQFSFLGYLKPEMPLKQLEKGIWTKVFIEAPHRNQQLLSQLLEELKGETWLSVAWDLTLPTQGVLTHTIATWRKNPLPNIHKKPTLFITYVGQ